jgi:hypothetical protein
MGERNAANVISLHLPDTRGRETEIARLVGWSPLGGLEIQCEDGRRLRAETTLPLDALTIQRAIAGGQRVLVTITASGLAVVTGFLQPVGLSQPDRAEAIDVHVDGDRLVLQGREEIELRCGHASIVLRRSGEIEIRGEKIVSRSRGANVVTGATIRLN